MLRGEQAAAMELPVMQLDTTRPPADPRARTPAPATGALPAIARRACSDVSCDVRASDTCTDCSDGSTLDDAGACASGCPATEYGVVDTGLQCYSCSGASCDVCPPNTCTDCSCTHISEVAATECVSARPATEYGVVDTDLQCSSGSDASCDACPSQHLHRLQQHLHLGRGGDERLCVPCDRVRRRGH